MTVMKRYVIYNPSTKEYHEGGSVWRETQTNPHLYNQIKYAKNALNRMFNSVANPRPTELLVIEVTLIIDHSVIVNVEE
jgi:hypothetical protein